MNRFTLLIASLGTLIAAIARMLADDGVAIAKIAGTKALNASADACGWLAAKLDAAAARVDAKRFVAAQ